MTENSRVLSFGCRLNIYESEVIKGHLPDQSKTIVVNTCAVTSEAERQARQAIRRAHRENPEAEIVVTGCAAQVNLKPLPRCPKSRVSWAIRKSWKPRPGRPMRRLSV